MQQAIFLDRDGVIIENQAAYVRSWADVEIFPQALVALRRLAELPYKIMIVTNQSVVGRGIIELAAAEALNQRLVEVIEQAGGRIDGVYMCPHAPETRCACRKPQPGLITEARNDWHIDLSRSIMVGDAVTDMQAGLAAGVGHLIMVTTGRGRVQLQQVDQDLRAKITIFESLQAYVEDLLINL
ncbi:MAG: D-glycero-beta-D-manno-heptose 1,7-bisphosphate 7-phosphatase [Ardenticatenaceae bacterium]|nr:D-glycero-beta-D-manno-heptose 1,7-bisphosphate 7-phosphatase [Ardenticatenaceae bacterium]